MNPPFGGYPWSGISWAGQPESTPTPVATYPNFAFGGYRWTGAPWTGVLGAGQVEPTSIPATVYSGFTFGGYPWTGAPWAGELTELPTARSSQEPPLDFPFNFYQIIRRRREPAVIPVTNPLLGVPFDSYLIIRRRRASSVVAVLDEASSILLCL